MGRNLKIKSPLRRDRFIGYEKVVVSIPKQIVNDSKRLTALNNPKLFYSFSHFVTCALIKMNKEFNK